MRKSDEVSGMVNFPVDSPEYTSTNEGGMFVQLWCVEEEHFSCGKCCGYNTVYAKMSEVLIGTEEERSEDNFDEIETGKVNPVDWVQRFELKEKLFPMTANESEEECETCRYLSSGLLACVTMGSTGWSGSDKDHEYWRCRYEDLSESGRLVYESLKKAYPKARLLLLTWLDT